jgi:hypothetical protein
MSNKNAEVIGVFKNILLVPNHPTDLLERLGKLVDMSYIESKYLLESDDLIKKKNILKYLKRNFL